MIHNQHFNKPTHFKCRIGILNILLVINLPDNVDRSPLSDNSVVAWTSVEIVAAWLLDDSVVAWLPGEIAATRLPDDVFAMMFLENNAKIKRR